MSDRLRRHDWRDADELRQTIAALRARLADTEETLRAISSGEVDALVVHGPDGESVYTLAGAERPYRVLIETIPEGAVTLGPSGEILYANTAFAAMLRLPLHRVLGADLPSLVHEEDAPVVRALLARGHQEALRAEVGLRTGDGGMLPVRVSTNPLPLDGASSGVCMVVSDLTEERKREEGILASLREKEALLREIHHRVKNNLQVVAGLLHLQARRTADAETRHIFLRSENRVLSMALIHESLYRSGDLACVSFGDYVRKLVDHLVGSHGPEREAVRVEVRSDDVLLPLESAVPLGLVINELVTNGFKHAFTGRPGGRILVELARPAPDRVRVVVEDDGVGFDPSVAAGRHTMGMQLVRTLVAQIDGTLEVRAGASGASFHIEARVGDPS